MKLHTALLAVVGLTVTVPAGAADPATSGALGVPANRLVGLWSTQAAVSPCGSNVPPSPVRNTIVFHAGGTVAENARFPPTGVPNVYGVPGINWRSTGLGTWSYDPTTSRYSMHLRFDWFVDGIYHGYQTVDRELLLSNDGLQAAGPVHTVRYATNGSTIIELCGTSVSDRL